MSNSLRKRRDDLVRAWTDRALAIFPAEAARVLKSVDNPFANPAGSTISTEVAFLFDALVDELPIDEITPRLERIVQIACVQDVPPSTALSFLFQLKEILRHELGSELRSPEGLESYLALEARIDRLALEAFDSYAGHKERIAQIRVRESRNRVAGLLRMTGTSWEDPAPCVPPPGDSRP